MAKETGGHKNLDAWKKSVNLVVEIYKLTSCFPQEEQFGLISQIRRSSVSIPSNIAEGAARNSNAEFIRFLNIAQGSLAELETQLIISRELGFLDSEDIFHLIDEIRSIIWGLQNYLNNKKT